MYNGMVYRGETICEKVSESAEQAVTSECHFWSMKIFLESESYRKGNVAKIELDGTDYAVNVKGAPCLAECSGKFPLTSASDCGILREKGGQQCQGKKRTYGN